MIRSRGTGFRRTFQLIVRFRKSRVTLSRKPYIMGLRHFIFNQSIGGKKMDEDERRDDSLTNNEARDVESGRMDAEEAHRYEEFRDLRNMLEEIRGSVRDMRSVVDGIRDSIGVFVDNGAVVRDGDEAELEKPDAVEFDTEGNIEEYVYDLDDMDLTL